MAMTGNWNIILSTPMGERAGLATLTVVDNGLTGTMTNEFGETPLEDGEVDGHHLFWRTKTTQPMPMTLEFEIDVDGDTMTGTVKFGSMGEAPMHGTRV